MKILVLYMPVLHKGYLELIAQVEPRMIGLLSLDVLQSLPESLSYIAKKDIVRALPTADMRAALAALYPPNEIAVLEFGQYELLQLGREQEIFMPDEDISTAVAEKYCGGVQRVTLVAPPAPRLRYNRNTVEEKKLLVPGRRTTITDLDREMMTEAAEAARRSPDWWRQVGGVLVLKDGRRIVAYNEHQPHEQIAATFGDPRSMFKSGVRTDLTFGDHAEHVAVGEAARQGISTADSSLYLTTFPCLACARLVVRAGVKRLFYRDPSYGLLDADQYLRMKEVELVEVSE